MTRVNYSLIFFSASLFILSSCSKESYLIPEKIRRVFVHLPNTRQVEVHQEKLRMMQREQNGQLAFQIDQLNSLVALPTSAISDIKTPAFTASDLDDLANRLLVFPSAERSNPYRFAENDLVDYPDKIYQQRFRMMSTDIPLRFNQQVKIFIELYAVRKRDLTQRMLGKSFLYYPYIEQALVEHGMPDELKHLVMVESAMETGAASSRAAAGLWQIRPITGRSLGLVINRTVDQRLDPYVSTQAAVRYLKRLRERYGDWLMAIAAYNCGPGNMHKAIVQSGGSKNFWRVQRFLPRETRNYIPAFMALVYLNTFQAEHNLHPVYPELSFRAVDTVRLYQEISLEKIAASTAVTLKELQFLNPALTRDKVPFWKDGYPLVLPLNKIARFEQGRRNLLTPVGYAEQIAQTANITKQKQAIVPDSPNLTKLVYRVRKGNTMVSVARRYGCSVKEIKDWNGKSDHIIRVGEELVIYVAKAQTSP